MKKSIIVLLALCLTLPLSSCKKGGDNGGGNGDGNSGTVVPYETMMSDIEIDNVLLFSRFEDKMMLVGTGGETQATRVFMFASDGGLVSEAELKRYDSDSSVITQTTAQAADVDSDGNIWVLCVTYDFREETMEITPTGSELTCYDSGGNILKTVELSEAPPTSLMSWNTLIIGNDGLFYLYSDSESFLFTNNAVTVSVFDENGGLVAEIDEYMGNDINGVYRLPDGRIIAKLSNTGISGTSAFFAKFDVSVNSSVERWTISREDDEGFRFETGNEIYELIKCGQEGVFGYHIETGESVSLINWESREIDNAMKRRVVLFEDNLMFSLLSGNRTVSLIKLAIADNVQIATDKKIITVADFGIWEEMEAAIRRFNAKSEEYRIQVTSYKDYGVDANSVITMFNTSIVAGNVPDIILFGSLPVPVDNYIQKGLFADLYELIDNDPDINREDYLPNVFGGLETDGKLFVGAVSFYINTLAGKTSDVGAEMGWTWDNYNSLMARQPAGITPIAYPWSAMTAQDYFNNAIISKMNNYIDYKSGICDFIDSDFVSFLTATDIFPKEAADINSSDFSRGNPLLMTVYITNFYEMKAWETLYFREELTFVGYPSDEGDCGSYGYAENRFAVSANANEPDGAWEFVKFLLSDVQRGFGWNALMDFEKHEISFSFNGFPIKISELERLASEAKIGLSLHALNSADIREGDKEERVELEVNSDEDNTKMLDLIYSVSRFVTYDQTVRYIIEEEAAGYFFGQNSAERVAEIVQNRVSLYLAEQR